VLNFKIRVPEIPALTCTNLCYELNILFPFCHFHQAYYLLPNTKWIWQHMLEKVCASRVVSFYVFLPFSSLICVSQSVCTCVSVLVREKSKWACVFLSPEPDCNNIFPKMTFNPCKQITTETISILPGLSTEQERINPGRSNQS